MDHSPPATIRGDWTRDLLVANNVMLEVSMAKLTDDDLTAIDGQRDQLEGRPQKRYGYAKDQARKDVDTWFSTLK
jgi:hypothetical protein